MYLQSIKSVKHNATKSVNRSILKKSRHIGFGVFIVHSSMLHSLTTMLAVIGKGSACYAHRQDRLRGRKGEKQHFVMLAVEGVIVESSPMSQEEAVEHVENYLIITYKVQYSQYCTCLLVTLIFNFDREVVFTVL